MLGVGLFPLLLLAHNYHLQPHQYAVPFNHLSSSHKTYFHFDDSELEIVVIILLPSVHGDGDTLRGSLPEGFHVALFSRRAIKNNLQKAEEDVLEDIQGPRIVEDNQSIIIVQSAIIVLPQLLKNQKELNRRHS